mgnify:CR=1 FL=1
MLGYLLLRCVFTNTFELVDEHFYDDVCIQICMCFVLENGLFCEIYAKG